MWAISIEESSKEQRLIWTELEMGGWKWVIKASQQQEPRKAKDVWGTTTVEE